MLNLRTYDALRCSTCIHTCIAILLHLLITLDTQAEGPETASTAHDWLSGELELGLNVGRSDRDGDIEIDQLLRLKVVPPEHDDIHLRTTLWTVEDLDGRESPTSAFRSLNDTSRSSVSTRLLSLYLEVEGDKDNSRLRLGRQRITDGVAFNRIDGAYFRASRNSWTYYAFLGARASVYENSSEDVSTGIGISWRPAPGTRAALDLFYGADERRRFGSDGIKATQTSLSLRHALNPYHNFFGRATWHEEELDEFRLTAQGVLHEDKLLYTVAYRRRISTLVERPTDFPQFYHVVGELNGYEDFQGVISLPIGERFELGLEAQVHDAEESMLSTGNRDYQRYGLSLDVNDIAQHYDVRIILELWDAAHGESERTISGEVSRQWTHTRAALGIDYDRFQDRIIQYDPLLQNAFFIESKDDIYVMYLRVRHKVNEHHSIQVRASVEDDDTSDAPYWRLRSQYTFRF